MGIVAGVVFIVAVLFFSGFFVGRNSGNSRIYGELRELRTMMQQHHQQMMGPGGMMSPYGPGQQPPTAPTSLTPSPPR